MAMDPRAAAEARALLTCIRVTEDPVEQNRLWNRYYQLSDRVFPEAAGLRARYRSLKGDERQRFKHEYMELVRRLWAATDPEAAYRGPLFADTTAPVAPALRPRRKAPAFQRWAVGAVIIVAALAGALFQWHYGSVYRSADGGYEQARAGDNLVPADGASDPQVVAPEPRVVTADPLPGSAPQRPVQDSAAAAPPVLEVSMEEIERELADEFRPEFTPMPDGLKGRGDRLIAPSVRYEDVYIIESGALFYVRIPERGAVESVSKDGAEVTLSADSAGRDVLLALWKQNREEIARIDAIREKEKAVRIADRRAALDRAEEERKAAREREWWDSKGAEWAALAPDQRHNARIRAHSNWWAVQDDAKKVEDLYYSIVRAYEYIGISDSRMARLNQAYQRAAQDRGPDFEVEDAFTIYGLGREEALRQLAEWEREYNRLLKAVEEQYPPREKRVEEIKRLDSYLPHASRLAEVTIDWDRPAPKAPSPVIAGESGSVGTGFLVADGSVMTCAHVVRGGSEITATSVTGDVYPATIVSIDTANDWALLKVDGLRGKPIRMASELPNVGATIYCLGYPMGGIQGSADPIVGSGNVAALKRLDGDERFMQITAPVNPGSSGGPVLDQFGNWVGIVSLKLNDLQTLQEEQIVTQGMNYAIKSTYIQPLLDPGALVSTVRQKNASAPYYDLETLTSMLSPSIVKIQVK